MLSPILFKSQQAGSGPSRHPTQTSNREERYKRQYCEIFIEVTVHGIKDLLLAQNLDVHVLAIRKLVAQESIDHNVFPEDVRVFARNFKAGKRSPVHKRKWNLLCKVATSASSFARTPVHDCNAATVPA